MRKTRPLKEKMSELLTFVGPEHYMSDIRLAYKNYGPQ